MSADLPSWLRADPAGAAVRIHVRPRAARAGIAGVHGQALAVRVTAPPVDEAANREVVRLLGALLGVRPAAVAIAQGAHGRDKWVRIAGLGPEAVRERLRALLSVDTPDGHD